MDEVRSLHARILGALSHAPAPLRLKPLGPGQVPAVAGSVVGAGAVGGPAGVSSGGNEWPGGAGFRQATFAEVREFFDNPKASRANATNPFLVMQANLYVTQVCHKFSLIRTKTNSYFLATCSLCD